MSLNKCFGFLFEAAPSPKSLIRYLFKWNFKSGVVHILNPIDPGGRGGRYFAPSLTPPIGILFEMARDAFKNDLVL